MKFGIEIECQFPVRVLDRDYPSPELWTEEKVQCWLNDNGAGKWIFHYDGSVNNGNGGYGCEFVSVPLETNEDGLEVVRRMFELLKKEGATTDNSCGLHVHVDASHFDIDLYKTIMYRYAHLEMYFDRFMTKSRGDNAYCKSIKNSNWGASRISDITYSDRYRKINPQAYSKHQTIEFRQHHGTVDVEEAINWIKFIEYFIEQCRKYNNKFVEKIIQPEFRNRGPLNRTISFVNSLRRAVRNHYLDMNSFEAPFNYGKFVADRGDSPYKRKMLLKVLRHVNYTDTLEMLPYYITNESYVVESMIGMIYEISVVPKHTACLSNDLIEKDPIETGIDVNVMKHMLDRVEKYAA